MEGFGCARGTNWARLPRDYEVWRVVRLRSVRLGFENEPPEEHFKGDIGEKVVQFRDLAGSPTPHPNLLPYTTTACRPTPLPPRGEAIGMENRIYLGLRKHMKDYPRLALVIKPCMFAFCLLLSLAAVSAFSEESRAPVRVGIIGLVHTHVRGFLPQALTNSEVQVVGIVEPDRELVAQLARQYQINTNLFYGSLEELFAKTNVQAVATFTSTFDHRRVVEACAPRGIDVMMEKPLAVNMEQARAMAAAAKKGGIHLLVNYETTWYSANHAAYKLVTEEKAIGELRKFVVHDGHPGPKKIGCPPEFLKWLLDPVLDGGGALPDFGCYGADLMTWLMQGQRPTSVFAVTQHLQPDLYPKVEDEATVVVTYPKAQGIIQASWNWPYNRKDMEIYGQTGYVLASRGGMCCGC